MGAGAYLSGFVSIVHDCKLHGAFWDVTADGLLNVYIDGKTHSRTQPAPLTPASPGRSCAK